MKDVIVIGAGLAGSEATINWLKGDIMYFYMR